MFLFLSIILSIIVLWLLQFFVIGFRFFFPILLLAGISIFLSAPYLPRWASFVSLFNLFHLISLFLIAFSLCSSPPPLSQKHSILLFQWYCYRCCGFTPYTALFLQQTCSQKEHNWYWNIARRLFICWLHCSLDCFSRNRFCTRELVLPFCVHSHCWSL